MALWAIRILFLGLCTGGGYAISQVRSEWLGHGAWFLIAGFGFGWLLIAIDEMLKGFSLRAFSATTFGLLLGTLVALLIDHSGLFGEPNDNSPHRLIVRLALFVGFGYIGMVLAMRSNKEDFSLIIPYIRFAPQNKPDNLLLLDTSAIVDGRIADLIEATFIEGLIVVPRFVLKELQQLADSNDPLKRARGRRGLDILNRIQRNTRNEVKILSLIHISEPTRLLSNSYAVLCLKKKKTTRTFHLPRLHTHPTIPYPLFILLLLSTQPTTYRYTHT